MEKQHVVFLLSVCIYLIFCELQAAKLHIEPIYYNLCQTSPELHLSDHLEMKAVFRGQTRLVDSGITFLCTNSKAALKQVTEQKSDSFFFSRNSKENIKEKPGDQFQSDKMGVCKGGVAFPTST